MTQPILTVEGLTITFPTAQGPIDVVNDVSFVLGQEKLGIVGESGSGKSMTARALMGLVPPPGKVTARVLSYRGENLMAAPPERLWKLRGAHLSMILQDPKFSLNPVMRIGDQIAEAVRLHATTTRAHAKEIALALLARVRIDGPERVYDLYPHEISGGMGQRVMIAMMIAANPDILIADEPTSALDVTIRGQVLDLLDELIAEHNTSLIFISHDLNLVARYCDRILVMYQGRVMETLPAADLHKSEHPYTRGLVECLPKLSDDRDRLPVLDRTAL